MFAMAKLKANRGPLGEEILPFRFTALFEGNDYRKEGLIAFIAFSAKLILWIRQI